MKPKPLSALKNLTVPVATKLISDRHRPQSSAGSASRDYRLGAATGAAGPQASAPAKTRCSLRAVRIDHDTVSTIAAIVMVRQVTVLIAMNCPTGSVTSI